MSLYNIIFTLALVVAVGGLIIQYINSGKRGKPQNEDERKKADKMKGRYPIVIVVFIIAIFLINISNIIEYIGTKDVQGPSREYNRSPYSGTDIDGMNAFDTPQESEYWEQHALRSISIKILKTWKEIQQREGDDPHPYFNSVYSSSNDIVDLIIFETNISVYNKTLTLKEHADNQIEYIQNSAFPNSKDWNIGKIEDTTVGNLESNGMIPAVKRESTMTLGDFPSAFTQYVFLSNEYYVEVYFVSTVSAFEDFPELFNNIISSIAIRDEG